MNVLVVFPIHLPPGRPGTGVNVGSAGPLVLVVGCWPCALPHMIFNRRPFKISLLKDRSAADSAEAREVKQTKAQFCLGTIDIERSSPN